MRSGVILGSTAMTLGKEVGSPKLTRWRGATKGEWDTGKWAGEPDSQPCAMVINPF